MSLREIDILVNKDLQDIGEVDTKDRPFNPVINRLVHFEARVGAFEEDIPLDEQKSEHVEDLYNLNEYLNRPNHIKSETYLIPVRYNAKRKIVLNANFVSATEPLLFYTPESDDLLVRYGENKLADFFVDLRNKHATKAIETKDRLDHISFYYSMIPGEDADRFFITFRTHKDDIDFINTVPNMLIKDYVQICYSEPIKGDKKEIQESYGVFLEFLNDTHSTEFTFKKRVDSELVSIIKNARDFWFSILKSYNAEHYKSNHRFKILNYLFKERSQ